MSQEGTSRAPMSAVRLALLGRRARGEGLHHLSEPLAIVGMGCRLPGGVESPDDFWDLISRGAITVGDVPPDRWDVDEWYDPDPSTPGRTSVKSANFLEDVDHFDAAFFGIPPREAERMDPHQRLALEVAWEALEDAGVSMEDVRGRPVGVFAASYNNDFVLHHYLRPDSINERTITGVVHAVVANRISHFLGIHGPSVTVDTACSSSLVALHLAARSLRDGSCDLALAGGVSLMLRPEPFISLSKAGFMSPDGRCKTFDARADGFGRGEGCGFLVLKRLGGALEAGDRVVAVLRGSAVNQDGPSTILAAPNGRAQVQVVRDALRDARVEASAIGYVEAHGTGTRLGDPIEVESMSEALGPPAPGARRWLASAKANIGHLEAAAGVVGVIRAALAIDRGWIPPHAGFETVNPFLDLEDQGFEIPTQGRRWDGPEPRTAGVSSFGVGGTNAHVILEAPPAVPVPEPTTTAPPWPLLLSARSDEARDALALRYAELLAGEDADPERFRATCAAVATRRTRLEHRMAVVASSAADAASSLREAVDGVSAPTSGIRRGTVPPGHEGKLVFVFSGQGSQWEGMGAQLARDEAVFREALEEVDRLFEPRAGWSVLALLQGRDAPWSLQDTAGAQPAIFAIQVALARLLESWGIVPSMVVGHSIGEIAAANVAGLLELETAVAMVHQRGRLMQEADSRGAMLAARLTRTEAEEVAREAAGSIQLAAINGPRSVVFSGPGADVDALETRLQDRDLRVKRLPVRYGFHSDMMTPIAGRIRSALDDVTPDLREGSTPGCEVFSTITGTALSGGFGVDHLARGVDGPVLFEPAVSRALERGGTAFLEVGPRPVLTADLLDIAETSGRTVPAFSTLAPDRPGRAALVSVVGDLFCAGIEADWPAVTGTAPPSVRLPSYPWQRKRFWLDTPERAAAPAGSPAGSGFLLGRRMDSPALQDPVFEKTLHAADPTVADHRLRGTVLVPAAMMLEMSRQAGEQVLGRPVDTEDAVFLQKVVLDDEPRPLQLVVTDADGPSPQVEIHARGASGSWSLAFQARLTDAGDASMVDATPPEAIEARCRDRVDVENLYRRAAEAGAEFGTDYRRLSWLQTGDDEALGRLDLHGVRIGAGLPPSVLDAALHPTLALLGPDAVLHLPASVSSFRADGSGTPASTWVREVEAPEGARAFDVRLLDEDGSVVAALDGLLLRPAPVDFAALQRPEAALHRVAWTEVEPSGEAPADLAACRILGDAGGFGARLSEVLSADGMETRLLTGPGASGDTGDTATAWVFCQALDESDEELTGAELTEHLTSLAEPVLRRLEGFGEHQTRLLLLSRGAHAPDEGDETTHPRAAGLAGLARTLRRERPELAATALDLPARPEKGEVDTVGRVLRGSSTEPVLALRGGRMLAPRLQAPAPDPSRRNGPGSRTRIVELAEPGNLDSLRVVEAPRRDPTGDEVEVRVLRAALNFRDVLAGLGMVDARTDAALGHECAGVVTRVGPDVSRLEPGDRILALAEGGFGDHVLCRERRTFRLPRGTGWSAAVTLPIAYLTAYHALITLGRLREGRRVLVHSGAGGVGQAAVRLALEVGAEVYATAGTPEKRSFLESMGVRGAFDSRSLSFREAVLDATGGEGVDVVVNSLTDEAVDAGLDLLPRGGVFVELGKRDVRDASVVAERWSGVEYHTFDLFDEIDAHPGDQAESWKSIRSGMEEGRLSALPMEVFPRARVGDAFRFMSRAEHVGKIVLHVSDRREPASVRPDATYLVTGGTGGVGLATARWLVDRGAGAVVLSSRTPPEGDAADTIEELQATGAEVRWIAANLDDPDDVRRLVAQTGDDERPLRGVVHAAASLDDGLLEDLDPARYATPFRAKVGGTVHLTRALEPDRLDFLLLYSAAGSLLDPAGQGNYAAANATLEALAHQLNRRGWPATAVAWGLWDRGMAGRLDAAGLRRWTGLGLQPIDSATAPGLLDAVLAQGRASVVPVLLDRARFLREAGHLDPLFDGLRRSGESGPKERPGAVADELRRLPDRRRGRALRGHLMDRLARVTGIERHELSMERPFRDQGMDSLMAVELRNTLTRDMGISLSSTIAFDHPDVPSLADHLAGLLFGDSGGDGVSQTPGEPVDAAPEVDPEIASLSDEEAERLLLEELEGMSGGTGFDS